MALEFGMTVKRLQREMTRQEFIYWQAYFRKNGVFGWRRDDWNHAVTRSEIADGNYSIDDPEKRRKFLEAKNFLLKFIEPERKKKKRSKKQIEKMEMQMEMAFRSIASNVIGLDEDFEEVELWQSPTLF